MSAIVRGLLFVANLAAGPGQASRASLIEFALRVPLVGMLASVTQLFRVADPAWGAGVVTSIALPLVAHGAELAAHTMAGTPQLRASLLASVAMSAVATAFNLFAMRRGTFIVGSGGRSLLEDLKELPRLIAAFVTTPLDSVSWPQRKPGAAPWKASTPR